MLLLKHFTKPCSKCKELKTFSEFSKGSDTKLGLKSSCKQCISIYNTEKKEEIRHKKREYHIKNKEKICAKTREWTKNNKDRKIETDREYREKNKEKQTLVQKEYYHKNKLFIGIKRREYYLKNEKKRKEYAKNYYQENKERCMYLAKLYVENNRDKLNEYFRKRRLSPIGRANEINQRNKRRTATKQGDVTSKQLLDLQNNAKICYWCGVSLKKVKTHIDHYTPISKGGKHTISNLVVSCAFCNISKNDKDPIKFANKKGKLL